MCLIDFGLAIRASPEEFLGTACGTPSYMSPEMLSKSGYLGGPNDVWAIGVMFYYLLTSTYPFGGNFLIIRPSGRLEDKNPSARLQLLSLESGLEEHHSVHIHSEREQEADKLRSSPDITKLSRLSYWRRQ